MNPSSPEPPNHRSSDGIDRRGFLECMTWAGTGVLWSLSGGLLTSRLLGADAPAAGADFTFVQISDSHIGFNKPANTDVTGACRDAMQRINALPRTPDFMLHTGDLTHLAEDGEFSVLEQVLKECRVKDVFCVPGEHDVLNDNGAQYRARFSKAAKGGGWHSFDIKGVHFIGLSNVADIKEGGLGAIGREQLEWLGKDLAPLKSETPIVVFAHIPLWAVYPQWGWGTSDAEVALGMMKRFAAVTVLNGHIHQAMQKVEGNVTFHSARSLAFPQPAPGTAPKPGPMLVPADKLKSTLGLNQVRYTEGNHALAVIDTPFG